MFMAGSNQVIPTPQTWVGAYNIDGNSDYCGCDNDNTGGDNDNTGNTDGCGGDNGDNVGDDERDDDCSATSAQVLSTPNLG